VVGQKKAIKGATNEVRGGTATQSAQFDRDELTAKQLAKAVLAKTLRPRAGEIRRLAEAVLRKDISKGGKKKAREKKVRSEKLVKIPQPKRK
jgi:hypothetical protein